MDITMGHVIGALVGALLTGYAMYWWHFKKKRAYFTITLTGEADHFRTISRDIEEYIFFGFGFREVEEISANVNTANQYNVVYQVTERSLPGFQKKLRRLQKEYNFTIGEPIAMEDLLKS